MAELPPPPSRLPLLTLMCLLLLAAATPLALGRAAPAAVSIHELLREHGLPGGLLPRGVVSYTLDETTGLLEARLSSSCYVKYDDGEKAYFDTVVRGNLSRGALRGCEGLAQQELFVWLPVKGILSDPDSGVIMFDIGYATKTLSKSVFEDPPDCQPKLGAGAAAADAARRRDRRDFPGLTWRREAEGGGDEGHHHDLHLDSR
ncbi:hypothetical protein QYE76_040639 [Lolium multiflorum]|uniref:Uncharacterized protein n=1 Tax=Lolium multiflorum TaxID=4521 RepID=A0AAD8TC37_LOLMU|nr:hypothetical protein QYE76_040639 [Lolium multiflorum]